jgi:hypothetical protein
MLDLFMAADTPPDLNWLGPVVTAIGGVLVAAVGGASLIWRRSQDRKDAKEDKAVDAEIAVQPKVTDGWEEVRKARAEATTYYNLYRVFENLYYTVAAALRHLARRVRDSHPEQEFDKDVIEALAIEPPQTDGK